MSERCHPWRALIIAAQARELADADLCGDLDFSNVDDVCGRLETPEAIAHRERVDVTCGGGTARADTKSLPRGSEKAECVSSSSPEISVSDSF